MSIGALPVAFVFSSSKGISMRYPQRLRRLVGVVTSLVLLLGVGGLTAARPALAQDTGESWVPVTIVYSSDVKGHIEPCG